MGTTEPVQPGRTKRVQGLEAQIAESKHLRSLVRDPDLQAVTMERSRRRTLLGLWFFLALGLVFTTTGVQDFLAGDRPIADPLWWAAWTVEPMFAGLLIVLLNFEATILAHGIDPDSLWWARIKRVLLGSTLFMNVAPQLAPLIGPGSVNVGSLAVHAIIPLIVYGLAEVIPVIQARARAVILHGYAQADQAAPEPDVEPPREPAPEPAPTPEPQPEPEPISPPAPQPPEQPADSPGSTSSEPVSTGTVRKLPPQMVDTLARAREQVAAEGRALTAGDVQRAVRVPDDMAHRIADEFATTNGHPVG